MNYRTFREVMSEKLAQSSMGIVSIPFQKWTGWKTPTRPVMVQSFLTIEGEAHATSSLHLVRAYADDESDAAWREVFPFDHAGPITTLSELVVEIKNHPCVVDSDYPLDVTEYDTLMENLTELVATDALIRSSLR
jgi:hypothetical protein